MLLCIKNLTSVDIKVRKQGRFQKWRKVHPHNETIIGVKPGEQYQIFSKIGTFSFVKNEDKSIRRVLENKEKNSTMRFEYFEFNSNSSFLLIREKIKT